MSNRNFTIFIICFTALFFAVFYNLLSKIENPEIKVSINQPIGKTVEPLGEKNLGAITEILSTDQIKDSRTTINDNFTYLDNNKISSSSTDTLTNKTWNGVAIADAYVANDITASNYLPLAGGTMTNTLTIDQNSNARGINIDSEAVYWESLKIDSMSTIKNAVYFYSNAVKNANVAVLRIQDNNASNQQPAFIVDQNGNGQSLNIDSESTSATVLNIDAVNTSGNIVNVDSKFVIDYAGNVGIGTSTPAYALDVVGSIQTDTAFYGNTWSSYDGDSMNIKPSGDEDDFLSFKTVANRATIKVEGNSKIYVQSSDSDEVGIEYYKDASHSGGVIYYKNEELFGLTSQDPMVFKVCGDYDDYVKICSANNIPELSVASSSAFKINAGGTNSLLLNHDGGNVGIGTTSPSALFTIGATSTQQFLVDQLGVISDGVWNATALTDAYVSNTLTVDGYMQDEDINTFTELQSWVSDEVLLKAGTLTDAKYCIYDSASGDIICNSTPAGSGDVTDVFDCSTGDCNTMTVGTSEYLTYGTGYIDANRFAGVTTVSGTEFGYLNNVSSAIQTQLDAKQGLDAQLTDLADGTLTGNFVNTAYPWADNEVSDTLTVTGYMQDTDIDTFAELQSWAVGYTDNNTTYVSSDWTLSDITGYAANDHIDWTADQGATNIHAGNYTDTNTTYTAGRSLTLDGTTINTDAELYTDQTGVWFEDPEVESMNNMWLGFMNNITITYIKCMTDTGTVDLNFEDGSDNNILSAELVCDAGGQTSCASGCDVNTINTSYDNITAKTENIDLDISATSTSPTELSIMIGFTIDD